MRISVKMPWATKIILRLAWLAMVSFQSPILQCQSLDVSQFGHTTWTTQEGSLPDSPLSVTQTTDGYLWIATPSHLFRFDGVRFVEQMSPQGNPLGSFKILGTGDGSLWIGGYHSGLWQLKDGKFTRYPDLDQVDVLAMLEDREGSLWVGGFRISGARLDGPPIRNLCRIQSEKTQCYGGQPFPGISVTSLFEDREGNMWAGTRSGLWRFRPGVQQLFEDKYAMQNTDISEDSAGRLLLADSNEIEVLATDGKLHMYNYTLDGKQIGATRFFKDRDGSLWIGTQGQGIVHIHDGRLDTFTKKDGLSSDMVYGLFEDREGNMWAATNGGLDRFRRLAVTVITERQGLSSDIVNSVLRNSNDLWVGTDGGLDLIDGSAITSFRTQQGLPSRIITSMFRTSSGRLLVATNTRNGMTWFENGRAIPMPTSGGEDILSITEDAQGDLWVLNLESGLMHLRNDGHLIETIPWAQVRVHGTSLTYDRERNAIWITGAYGDLGLAKNGKVIQRFGEADGLGTGVIQDARVEPDGSLWLSTSVGLARLQNGRVSTLNRKNGLPCDAMHWMEEDGKGDVWLYSECGLIRISKADLNTWEKNPGYKVRILNLFDSTDGVQLSKINGWYTPQVAVTSDGRVVLSMTTGLGVIDPKHIAQNVIPPPVHIEEITADGKQLPFSGALKTPKRVHTLHIDYTALSLVMPRKVRFRYQLEGYDRDWSEPVSTREATYTNLPPGRYRFRVIACNNNGVWNMEGASLDFRVPAAFTQTLWYPLLWAFAACACTLLFFIWRLNRVAALARERFAVRIAERERIAQDLHDTLLQGIQGLILRIGTAVRKFPETEPARKNMDEALDLAREVMVEGRDRVKNLRESYPPVADLVQQLREFCGTLERTTIKVTFAVEGTPRPITGVATEDIFQICKECLVNAYLHSKATEITCTVSFEERFLSVSCCDNGCGIAEETLSKGYAEDHFGLVGITERTGRLQGVCTFKSKEDVGTAVEVRVPGAVAYAPCDWHSRLRARMISIWRAAREILALSRTRAAKVR